MRTKKFFMTAIVFAMAALFAVPAFAVLPDLPGAYYVPGDVSGDKQVIGGDVTVLVNYFRGLATPPDSVYDEIADRWFYAAADANGDCNLLGGDVTWLVNYFRGLSTLDYCDNVPPRPTKLVYDTDISIGTAASQFVTWSKDTTYILDEFVFVDSGCVLTIEPGTVVKANPGQTVNAKALIVAQGGIIIADGTAEEPITFTAVTDFTGNAWGINGTTLLPPDARGLWGGLIVLGYARNNLTGLATEGTGYIEGLPEEPRTAYGGLNDCDSSGVIRYVRIRHGGTDIGDANEINGFTSGGLGANTVLEYIEVFANNDDGFEWFGGCPKMKYLVCAYMRDDNFDYDEGYRGLLQYGFIFQEPTIGNRGGEHDGGTSPEVGLPLCIPSHSNITIIGSGLGSSNADSDRCLYFRDNAGGHYANSIFCEFPGVGLKIEFDDSGFPDSNSHIRCTEDHLTITNSIYNRFGAGETFADIWDMDGAPFYCPDSLENYLLPNTVNVLTSIDWTPGAMGVDARPNTGDPAVDAIITDTFYGDLGTYADYSCPVYDPGFFDNVDYIGAFDPDVAAADLWIKGWTTLDEYGFLAD